MRVPSHDTFSRLFRMLDTKQFRAAFQRFMAGFSEQCEGVVAIDGTGSAPLVRQRQWEQPGCCPRSPPGPGATPCAGADRHRREVERNYRRAETAGDAAAEKERS